MEYEVVVGESLISLMEIVRKYIAVGFKPLGGIQVVNDSYNVKFFYQALTKIDDDLVKEEDLAILEASKVGG
jgi:hypothetical protein